MNLAYPGSLHSSRTGTSYIIFNITENIVYEYKSISNACDMNQHSVYHSDYGMNCTSLYRDRGEGGLIHLHTLQQVCE